MSMVSVQVVVVPGQSPLQPVNVYPEAVVAVRVTGVPLAYVLLHVPPEQLMPEGLLVTVPPPCGVTVTERVIA